MQQTLCLSQLVWSFVCPLVDTSREPKEGEEDGKGYYFVPREKMTELRRGNQFFEYGEYNDNMYGTSVDSVRSVIEQHKMCVLDIQPAVSTHRLKSHMLKQVCQQAVNMLMKRNFVQYFVDCIGRISLNSNITS